MTEDKQCLQRVERDTTEGRCLEEGCGKNMLLVWTDGVVYPDTSDHRKYYGTWKRSSTTPTPRFEQSVATLNPFSHTGRTFSFNVMMDLPGFQISEMHLGKFPDSLEFPQLESQLQD